MEVSPEDARKIVQGYLVNNNLVTRLLYKDPAQAGRHLEKRHDMGFYKEQQRVALYNCGLINPELIEEYLAAEGYQGLAKCLQTMRPDQVVNEIRISGLRGRGGGFPSGVKWEVAARRESDLNYVVCNADEGDPGAFMAMSISGRNTSWPSNACSMRSRCRPLFQGSD